MFIITLIGVLTLTTKCLSLTVRDDVEERPVLIYKASSSSIPTRYIIASDRSAQATSRDEQLYLNPRQLQRYRQQIAEDATHEADEDEYYYKQPPTTRVPQVQRQSQFHYGFHPGLASQKELDQIFRNIQQPTIKLLKKPPVEQYLKEVTPTTKTSYNNNVRPTPYARFIASQGKPQQLQETQRTIVKQAPVQYVYQTDSQQQPSYPHHQYIQPQPQYETIQQEEQPRPRPKYRPQPTQPTESSSYYNTGPLTHQKPVANNEVPQEATSQSTVFVSQNFLKKPQRVYVKTGQPKATTVRNLQSTRQDYQNLIQSGYATSEQENVPYQQEGVVDPVRYQPVVELPQPLKENYPVITKGNTRHRPVNRQNVRLQIEEKEPVAPEPIAYQNEDKEPIRYQAALARNIRYQQRTREPVTYQPEIKEPLTYQSGISRESVRYAVPTTEQVDYESEEKEPVRYRASQREIPNYPVATNRGVRYQVNKPELKYPEVQREASYPDEENVQAGRYQPGAIVRFRPGGGGAAVAYQQNLENSNIRYYRKLSRPLSYQQQSE